MSTSDPSDELKLIYRRILRRVHPDLAVDEQDRITCERLTREANAAYQAGDLAALKAVLQPKPAEQPQPPSNIWEPWTYTEARQPLRQQPPPPQPPPPPPPQQPRPQTPPPPRSEQPWRQPPPPRAGAAIPTAPAFTQISNDSPKGLGVALAVGLLVVIGALFVNRGNLHALSHYFSATLQASARPTNDGAEHPQPGTSAQPEIVQSQLDPPTVQSYVNPSWVGCTKIGGGRSDSTRMIALVQSSLVKNLALWPVTGRTGIRFKLYRDGSVKDMTLDYPSGVAQRDNEAWQSITRSAPFTEVARYSPFSAPFVEVGCYFIFNSLDQPDLPLYQAPVNVAAAGGPGSDPAADPSAASPPKSQSTPAVVDFDRQYPWYMDALKSRVTHAFFPSEVVDSPPPGSTVFVQFVVSREGYLGAMAVKASSGYPSLDESCLHALKRVENFGKLPEGYQESSLRVLYHCTYPGSSVKSVPPQAQAAQSMQPGTGPNKPSE